MRLVRQHQFEKDRVQSVSENGQNREADEQKDVA